MVTALVRYRQRLMWATRCLQTAEQQRTEWRMAICSCFGNPQDPVAGDN